MYRDSANAVDEHDRAVGAILIGEALVDECLRAATVIRQPETTTHNERWRTLTDVHDTYPEIWRHLDRARTVLANRGANTAAYDEMRPHARRAPTNADGDIDDTALDDARRAIEDLKLAVPGADWKAIAARTRRLAGARLSRPHGQRTVVVALLAMFTFALLAWIVAIVPDKKIPKAELMRRELSEISGQRKLRNEILRVELGTRCDVPRARELAKGLAMDGRTSEAKEFGTDYMARCGDDPVVDNWAHAPRPPARD